MSIRGNLKEMFRSNSMDEELSKVLRSERKSLGSKIIRLRDSPKRLLSERMAAIEVRIQRIKRLSPLRLGSKSVGEESGLVDERDSVEVDIKIDHADGDVTEGYDRDQAGQGLRKPSWADIAGNRGNTYSPNEPKSKGLTSNCDRAVLVDVGSR
ncbi:hypothetical protein U1Q18_009803 [Sarracenia purpurea var. burkii]